MNNFWSVSDRSAFVLASGWDSGTSITSPSEAVWGEVRGSVCLGEINLDAMSGFWVDSIRDFAFLDSSREFSCIRGASSLTK
jgi:hypothetical protein